MPKLNFPNGRRAAAVTAKDPDLEQPDPDQVTHEEQPEVVVQDDASIAFQKQIDALRASEKLQKEHNEQLVREREDAIRRANEREAEVHRLKKSNVESRAEAVASGLAAAMAEAQAAQGDLEKAFELGDFKGQAAATNRLSKAHSDIASLESGKMAMELQAKEADETQAERPKDPLDTFNIPELAKDWLRAHPEYLNVPRKNAMIQNLHYEVVDEGHAPYSQDYFVSLEQHLGLREKPGTNREQEIEAEPQERTRNVSAPVSRDNPPSSSGERPGRITLSSMQKEAAKISGISEKDYAENLLKLKAEKLNGNYGGAP